MRRCQRNLHTSDSDAHEYVLKFPACAASAWRGSRPERAIFGSTPIYGSTNYYDLIAPLTFSFAGISAATYDLKVLISSATGLSNNEGMYLILDESSAIQLIGETGPIEPPIDPPTEPPTVPPTTVPEPGTSALVLAGLAGVGVVTRRRRRVPQ